MVVGCSRAVFSGRASVGGRAAEGVGVASAAAAVDGADVVVVTRSVLVVDSSFAYGAAGSGFVAYRVVARVGSVVGRTVAGRLTRLGGAGRGGRGC